MAQKIHKNTVLMIVHSYYPEDARVRRESIAIREAGHCVDIICLRKKGQKSRDNFKGINIFRIPVSRHRGASLPVYLIEYFTFAIMSFIQTIFRKLYDIYYIHNPPDFLVFIPLIQKLLGKKVIIDIHDRVPKLYQSRFRKYPILLSTTKLVEKGSLIFANHIVTVHDVYKQDLSSLGIRSEKITCVLNSADDQLFKPTNKTSINGYMMHHGTLVERYGSLVLLKACSKLRRKEFRCSVFGEGDILPVLKKMTTDMKLDDNVTLHGFIPLEELPSKISECSVGIVPHLNDSFTEDVLPTKMLEYIVMRKPVIVSKTKTVEYFFSDNEVTFVIPGDEEDLAKKLDNFLVDPGQFQAKAEQAYKKYQDICWGVQKQRLVAMINSI